MICHTGYPVSFAISCIRYPPTIEQADQKNTMRLVSTHQIDTLFDRCREACLALFVLGMIKHYWFSQPPANSGPSVSPTRDVEARDTVAIMPRHKLQLSDPIIKISAKPSRVFFLTPIINNQYCIYSYFRCHPHKLRPFLPQKIKQRRVPQAMCGFQHSTSICGQVIRLT